MPRNYHDIGGLPAGAVAKTERELLPWEWQCEAIRGLLGNAMNRLISLDELRRSFETFGYPLYGALEFYERRLEAMLRVLDEKGVVERDELERRIERLRAARAAG